MFIIKAIVYAFSFCFKAFFGFSTFLLKNVFFVAFALTLIVVAFFFVNFFVNPITLIRPKKPLSFDVPAVDGGRFLSTSMANTNYLLFFTGSVCKKCLEQLEKIESIKNKYSIPVYVVFREGNEVVGKVTNLYARVATRTIIDPFGVLNSKAYVFIVPHLSLVNKQGVIVFDVTGNISDREVAKLGKKIEAVGESS